MIAVVSPHTDDAVFSIGAHLATLVDESITVVSPLAGIPDDEAGREKHARLRAEHATAMKAMGWQHINGDFLDDVYPTPDRDELTSWLAEQLQDADTVYVPLGIRHPDHVMVSDIVPQLPGRKVYYAELPYRVMYPEMAAARLDAVRGELVEVIPTPAKESLVRLYDSQIRRRDGSDLVDGELVAYLMTMERVWR